MKLSKEQIEAIPKMKCRHCDGYGFTAEHDRNDPHEFGCSGSCPIQVLCDQCHGDGYYVTIDELRELDLPSVRISDEVIGKMIMKTEIKDLKERLEKSPFEFEHFPELPEQNWVGTFNYRGIGIVASGNTRSEAIQELMKSIAVKIELDYFDRTKT
jgi:hypothetical protein